MAGLLLSACNFTKCNGGKNKCASKSSKNILSKNILVKRVCKFCCLAFFHKKKFQGKRVRKKSRIRETPTLSTNADSRTNTNLKRLRDFFLILFFIGCMIFFYFIFSCPFFSTLNWSCDHRAIERARKKSNLKGTNKQTDTQTDFATIRQTRPRKPSWWKKLIGEK